MQRKLSQWATGDPTKKFVDLYSLLCNEVWLRVAHHKVNTNQGRETAGIDWQSMSNFNGDLEGNLERLRGLLKAKTFEPLPVRRVYIPKANESIKTLGVKLPEALPPRTPPLTADPGTTAGTPSRVPDSGLSLAFVT